MDFALRRAARDPTPYGAVFIMLMVAAAVGMFAATFQSTVARSSSDQSLYRSGADVALVDPVGFDRETIDSLAALEGVDAVSSVSRYQVGMADRVVRSGALLMAVDPETMSQASWFRSDFAEGSLDSLMGELITQEPSEMDSTPIPVGSESIGVWVDGSDLRDAHTQITIWARVTDANGFHHGFILYDKSVEGVDSPLIPGQGWTYMEGSLPSRESFPEPFGLTCRYS